MKFTTHINRVQLNGKEVKNPALKFAICFFALTLIALILLAFLAIFIPISVAIFITLLTSAGIMLIGLTTAGILATIGHPPLRMFGRRGFIQTGKDSATTTITTHGAFERE